MAESGNPYTKLMEKAFTDAIPLNCQIEITYRCNHLCSFCYNSPTGQREMTTEEIFTALAKISEFGVLYVTLTGGEALCHKDFYEIAAEVRRLGMALRVYSNGYLMADPKVVDKLKALTPTEIEISVHGSKPETHDALTRIKGSYEKTWTAIRNLTEAGLKVNLKCAITRLNQNELFELRDMGEALGLRVQFDSVITPKDDGNADPLALRADDEFIQKYWESGTPSFIGASCRRARITAPPKAGPIAGPAEPASRSIPTEISSPALPCGDPRAIFWRSRSSAMSGKSPRFCKKPGIWPST